MKKLFDIKYNNKVFTVFLAEGNRKTFLEKRSDGKYIYPTLEDYKYLNNVYNNHNPFVLDDFRDVFFQEKVRLASGVLAFVVGTNALASTFNNYKVEQLSDNYVMVSVDDSVQLKGRTFSSVDELTDILGYDKISIEEVYEAIDNNTNLNEYYKTIARNLVNKVREEIPNYDLRIFYENIKTLRVVELNPEEEEKVLGESVTANYNSYYNQINLSNNAPLATVYHEFAHAMNSFCTILKNGQILLRTNDNTELNEAMTNKIVSLIAPANSYHTEGIILDYLLSFGGYTLEDYNKYGIDELITRLQKRYPEIDFNYISNFINGITDTQKELQYSISLSNCSEFLDEVFNLTLASIDLKGNVYEPFVNFAKLLENNQKVFNTYLERYNAHLKTLGYKNIITVEYLDDLASEYDYYNFVAIYENEAYLAYMASLMIDNAAVYLMHGDKPSEEAVTIDEEDVTYINNMDYLIKSNYLKHRDIYGTPEFWSLMIEENQLIDKMRYEKVPIYWNGEFLGEEYLKNLEVEIKKVNGEIKFSLVNKGESKREYISKPLLDYLALYQLNGDKLELADVFNETYLKYEEGQVNLFENIIVADDNIMVLPYSRLCIGDYRCYCPLWQLNITLYDGYLQIPFLDYSEPISFSKNVKIKFSNILLSYGLLDESKIEYVFTKEEIINLVTTYVTEQVLQNNSSFSR